MRTEANSEFRCSPFVRDFGNLGQVDFFERRNDCLLVLVCRRKRSVLFRTILARPRHVPGIHGDRVCKGLVNGLCLQCSGRQLLQSNIFQTAASLHLLKLVVVASVISVKRVFNMRKRPLNDNRSVPTPASFADTLIILVMKRARYPK